MVRETPKGSTAANQSNFAFVSNEGMLFASRNNSPRSQARKLRGILMVCREAEQLKQQVSHCTSVYLEADGQRDQSSGSVGEPGIVADFAMFALAEARRKYWFHVNQHHCESFEREKK